MPPWSVNCPRRSGRPAQKLLFLASPPGLLAGAPTSAGHVQECSQPGTWPLSCPRIPRDVESWFDHQGLTQSPHASRLSLRCNSDGRYACHGRTILKCIPAPWKGLSQTWGTRAHTPLQPGNTASAGMRGPALSTCWEPASRRGGSRSLLSPGSSPSPAVLSCAAADHSVRAPLTLGFSFGPVGVVWCLPGV